MTNSPVRRPGEPAPTTSLPRPQHLVTPNSTRWAERCALLVGSALILAGALQLDDGAHHRSPSWLIAGSAATAVGVGFHGWRTNRRRARVAALTNVLNQLTKTAVVIERARWKGLPVGRIIGLRLRYTDLAAAAYGTQITATLAQVVDQALGYPFITRTHNPTRRRIILASKPETPDRELTELEKQQQRVQDVVTQTLGADATIENIAANQDQHAITGFTVRVRSGASKLTIAGARRRLANAITERLVGAWTANFTLEGDTVTFTRRPPLPTYVQRPATPAPAADDPDYGRIPQAIDEHGNLLAWEITGIQAHILKAGRTRSGKTISLIGDAIEAARRGFKVFVLDPKRIEFLGLRGWPNVQLVATRVPEQVALVHYLWTEMTERYRQVEEDGAQESDFQPILFIIDEYRQLHANVNAWWRSIKVTGMQSECPIFEEIGALLRMAAACRIHVDLATQRPDAEFLGGEALATDTPIPTPAGWATIADLDVGQYVFDERGQPAQIIAATDVQRGRPCYRVTFSDHSSLVADENHLWTVTQATERRSDLISSLTTGMLLPAPCWRRGPQTVTTRHLAETVHDDRGSTWAVQTAEPLELPERELPIDPWLLGYWLGDGHKAAATIAAADGQILDRIRGLGFGVTDYARYNCGISTGPCSGSTRPSLQRSLRQLGLPHNKHVPAPYLRGSRHQRAELLAGLLDAHGSCHAGARSRRSRQTTFSHSDRGLIDAVHELAASLGYSPTITRWGGAELHPRSVAYEHTTLKDAWTVQFTPAQQLFGIGRKQPNLQPALLQGRPPARWRYIVSVIPVESVPVRCITVDTPSHLYLAGRSFIPTHNCRDNFSARAATGRLSPDGAAMMFDSQHVGITIPMNVRGRGTMIGLDDRPQEVQFLYTPDPRRPRNDDDRALLSALRPETTSWPRLVMQLPEIDEIVDDIPQGKKTNLEWEQLIRARFVQADSIHSPELADDDTDAHHNQIPERQDSSMDAQPGDRERSDDDACADYREPALVPAGMASVGDLLRDDERGWLTITDIARDRDLPEVQLEWQDANGSTGDLLMARSELVEICRLQVS